MPGVSRKTSSFNWSLASYDEHPAVTCYQLLERSKVVWTGAIAFKDYCTEKTDTMSFLRKMFFRLVTSVGQRKKKEIILSPVRNRTSPSDLRSDALPLSHKDSSVSGVYYGVLMTRVLHTARISNVDSVMFLTEK